MERRDMIRLLKGKIKELAVIQKKTKLARKTKSIDPELRKKLLEELGIKYPDWAVYEHRAEITAHLNLYHELRGSGHRHNVSEEYSYKHEYQHTMNKLREELGVLTGA